jgi:hypothetical protein
MPRSINRSPFATHFSLESFGLIFVIVALKGKPPKGAVATER